MNLRTAGDLAVYLKGLCPVDEPSVDKIIVGREDTEIKKIGTCWMAYFELIQRAYQQGVNVLVCHEPVFYSHHDLEVREREFDWAERRLGLKKGQNAYDKMIEEKKEWILEHGMTIIRCHDVLDKIQGFGIPFALGRALGFCDEDIIRSEKFFNVYRTPEKTALDTAKNIAECLKRFGQPGVAFYGDPKRMVNSVAIGTGCFCDPIQLMELEADFYLAIDDSIRTWIQTTYARDSGLPLAVINHGTSEEPGVALLSEYLKNTTGIDVEHFPCGCSYTWVSNE